MPELPEVETIRKGLEDLEGKKITQTFRSNKKLRIESAIDFDEIDQAEITNIKRRARYLIIDFDNKKSLIVHLGMSGRITIANEFKQLKHDHFACEFDDNSWFIFNDARRFGFVDLLMTKDLNKHPSLATLGPEPLSDEFDFKYLKQKLKNKKMNIKTAIMDNKIVVGVGNIYINESLFDSKILPTKNACDLKDDEIKKLISSIKKIIKRAIELGGSSISDYVKSTGEMGNFQANFKIYGKEGEKCLLCKNNIVRIVQNGRSTFYCHKCQK